MRMLRRHLTGAYDGPHVETEGLLLTKAESYDRHLAIITLGQEWRFRRMTLNLARVQSGETVLEVGCGTGSLALAAKQRVGADGQVYGIDPSAPMLARARSKAAQRGLAVSFQQGVIERLPFADQTFDVVLSSLMMHHLPDEVKRQGLAEIARTLKPGGRLFVLDTKHPTGPWRSSTASLPAMMRAAGFARAASGSTRIPGLGYAVGHTATAQPTVIA